MLGIPVGRVQTIVWVDRVSVLAFLALFLRTGAVGLPLGSPLGPCFLIQAIGAAVIGRFERLPHHRIARRSPSASSTRRMTFQPGNRPAFNDVMIFAHRPHRVALRPSGPPRPAPATWQLAERRRGPPGPCGARRGSPRSASSSWGSAPSSSRSSCWSRRCFSESQAQPRDGRRDLLRSSAVSLVVLTGWAGQVSLGQVAFMGIGACGRRRAHRATRAGTSASRCSSRGWWARSSP